MYSAILGYLIGKNRMQGQEFDLLRILRYDSGRHFFETTPVLSRMLHVSDYVRKYRLETKEQIAAFVSELSFIERNSEYLPLYLLPVAFAPTADALAHVILATYEAARSLTDDEQTIRDCVLTVAVTRWSIKKLGDAESYLNRLLDKTQGDDAEATESHVVRAIRIGLSYRAYVEPIYGTIGQAILRAALSRGDHPDIQSCIAATVAEYNHEELGFYEMTSNMGGSSEESVQKDIAPEEFPLKKTVQCRTWDGQLLKGYKRMDGYYGWHVRHGAFECCLIGTMEKPFDKELVIWRWFEAHWKPQSIIQTIEEFEREYQLRLPYTEEYRLDWFNKLIYVPVGDDKLFIDFRHCQFEMNIVLNSAAFDYYVENLDETTPETDCEGEPEETVKEEVFDRELTDSSYQIYDYDAYLSAHRYGSLTWNREELTRLIEDMTDYEFQFYFLPSLLRQGEVPMDKLTTERIQKALKQKGQQYDCSGMIIRNKTDAPIPYILFSFPKENVVSPCAFHTMAIVHQEEMKYFTFEKGDGTNFLCQITESRHINMEEIKENLGNEEFSERVLSHLNKTHKSLFDDFWEDD